MRFLQLRQDELPDEICNPYSLLTKNLKEAKETYCYGDYTLNQNDSSKFFTFHNKIRNEDAIFKNGCEKNMSYSPDCEILNGFKYRTINESYWYTGGVQSYNIDSGFYFDLPMINKDNPYDFLNYHYISDFLKYYWVDLSTRLVMISFNALDTDNLQTLYTIK